MAEPRVHLPQILPCPYLPLPGEVLTHSCMQVLGKERGTSFYETALRYAASLWLQGYPARSLLLINRAFTASLTSDEPILQRWPLPYAAVAWILANRPSEEHFLGNPRRHYQHLATRMVGPQKERRTWRAWACWDLAREILPADEFPADEKQISEEGVIEPDHGEIRDQLEKHGIVGESTVWEKAFSRSG